MSTEFVSLLPFFCPAPGAIHPQVAAIEEDCCRWIDRFELYTDAASRERLINTKAAEIYARALPEAPAARVAAVAKWLYWGFATDDLLYDHGPVSVSARSFIQLAVKLVRICEEPRARVAPEPPYTDALRDLTIGITALASPTNKLEWVTTARAWFMGMSWDSANAEQGRPPSLNDYLMMRMHTGGLASWITTLNIANGIELPSEELAQSGVRALFEAWSTFCLLINDLESYNKERNNGERSSNVVSVIMSEIGCSVTEAVHSAYSLCDQISLIFLRLRLQVLASASPELQTCIQSLGLSWRGIIEWGFRSSRYVSLDGHTQVFPGWTSQPRQPGLRPNDYPSISWWWNELVEERAAEPHTSLLAW